MKNKARGYRYQLRALYLDLRLGASEHVFEEIMVGINSNGIRGRSYLGRENAVPLWGKRMASGAYVLQ